MKKILALLLLSGLAAHADPFGDWWYYVINNEATITRYTGSGGAVTIPKKINGGLVNRVGFDDYYTTNITILTIPAPNSVMCIAANAFRGCTSLTSITIPNSVICIGDNAFRGCTSLTSITIPKSVELIGRGAFRGCTSLTSITIFDSVMSIGFSCPAHVNTDFDLLFRDSRTFWEWRTSLVSDVKELNMDPTWDAEKEAGEEAVIYAPDDDVLYLPDTNLIPLKQAAGRALGLDWEDLAEQAIGSALDRGLFKIPLNK